MNGPPGVMFHLPRYVSCKCSETKENHIHLFYVNKAMGVNKMCLVFSHVGQMSLIFVNASQFTVLEVLIP